MPQAIPTLLDSYLVRDTSMEESIAYCLILLRRFAKAELSKDFEKHVLHLHWVITRVPADEQREAFDAFHDDLLDDYCHYVQECPVDEESLTYPLAPDDIDLLRDQVINEFEEYFEATYFAIFNALAILFKREN